MTKQSRFSGVLRRESLSSAPSHYHERFLTRAWLAGSWLRGRIIEDDRRGEAGASHFIHPSGAAAERRRTKWEHGLL